VKGIILAGGTGSRLLPLTKATNKHLLPVGDKPMVLYPVEKLRGAGIEEILIVTGPEHLGSMVSLLGSGKDYGCEFTYKAQDQAGGIAQALGLASHFSHDDQMCVILGDNIFKDSLRSFAEDFIVKKRSAKVLLQKVADPERFGVAEIEGDKIINIVEKPKNPKSDYAVTGIYFFSPDVFEIIKSVKPSGRGELEISDVTNSYVKRGEMSFNILENWWTDAGTFESLALATELVRKSPPL